MGKLKSYQEQLQDIVAKGINTAEEQQKKLSSKPFEYAEKLESEVREYSVKSLRERYDGYSESLFSQLRDLNTRFGRFAGDLVARLEKEAAESADAVAEAADDVAEEVEEAAEAAKEAINGAEEKKAPAKKPAARKTTAAKKASTTA